LKDEAPLKSILGRFSSGPQATLKSEKYKDGELFVMPLPAGETAISVSQKTFYLGGSKSDLQSLLDRTTIGGSGLAASEGFKKLASSVPATVSMLSYGSRDYTKKSFDNMLQTLGSVGDADAKRLASAAAALGEVLGESIGYGVWRENGLYSAGMTLYR
jgi:hypothetical protein